MTNFATFSDAIDVQFAKMAASELFIVGKEVVLTEDETTRDLLWKTYLQSFPEGTDPTFIERSTHDCSCCRHFVKNIGGVVSFINGKKVSVWDADNFEYPYNEVAEKMSALVHSLTVLSIFRTQETQFGAKTTKSLGADGQVKTWHHFGAKVPSRVRSSEAATLVSRSNAARGVFKRGLEELRPEAFTTVIDLIKAKNLYKGDEFLAPIKAFKAVIAAYKKCKTDKEKEAFIWENLDMPAARFRNTVIGTLLVDLSDGKPLDEAVRMFEAKVAPENYKRTKALITPAMITDALSTLKELDMEHAVERRFATFEDMSVNNVLFVDNAVQSQMKGGLEGLLMSQAKTKEPDFKKAKKITIDDFMSDVVPEATSIKAYVENSMLNSFVSLTSPQHGDSGGLFKWNNDFAWSYDGNYTDVVKERVKAAGGNVDNAAMRVSLSWYNSDDLDLHCIPPYSYEIYFGNKSGILDVDIMRPNPRGSAVENMSWVEIPVDGTYRFLVHNFSRREASDVGFDIQIEINGDIHDMHFDKSADKTAVVALVVKNGQVTIKPSKAMTSSVSSKEKWGINTSTLVDVQTMMFSPNFWDDNAVGNKHWFFILKDCINPEPARGIYNEFLTSKLEKHRKVFEILGDKTKCKPNDRQMSGLGFSSTKTASLKVVVNNKPYEVMFNA